jgi:hypothetical protein
LTSTTNKINQEPSSTIKSKSRKLILFYTSQSCLSFRPSFLGDLKKSMGRNNTNNSATKRGKEKNKHTKAKQKKP